MIVAAIAAVYGIGAGYVYRSEQGETRGIERILAAALWPVWLAVEFARWITQ